MELLVTVVGTGPVPARVDVAIDADPAASCAELRDALVDAVDGTLTTPPGLAVRRDGLDLPLPLAETVFAAGITSGDELVLVPVVPGATSVLPPGSATPGDGAVVRFEVAAGPAAGRSVRLGPGRHDVGRATDGAVVLDDPALSSHHLTLDVDATGGVVLVPNPAATNGTIVNGTVVEEPVSLTAVHTVLAGTTLFAVRPVGSDGVADRDRLGQVGFNRVPYRRPVVAERTFPDLDPPPDKPGERRFPVVAVVLPIVGAVAISYVTGMYYFLAIAALSPLMMVANFFSEGQRSRRTHARDTADFAAAVDRRVGELELALERERAERFDAAPDLPVLARHAAGRLERLWERHRGSPDVLELRLGVGTAPSRITNGIRPGGDPDLRAPAEARLAVAEKLDVVPTTVALDEHGVTGVHGDPATVRAVGASLVVQAACLHSPEDLVIAAAVPADRLDDWSWLAWVPHTRSLTSPLDAVHLVTEADVDHWLLRLVDVVRDRLTDRRRDERPWPRLLVVIEEAVQPDRALLATLLESAAEAGVVVLWLGRDAHLLPRQCAALVEAVPPVSGRSTLWFTDPEHPSVFFEAAGIGVDVAERIARSLAPVRDASSGNAATSIPRVVPLLDTVDVDPTGAAVARRWSARATYGLRTALGTGAEGPFEVDLVEHGPHTLIAGTSGSGKSELLQTLVTGLALRYPPERLTFLFIDYKGGASSAPFAALPHTVGQVTNLDERLALRALASLRAELRRRMAVLEGRAKDLDEMLRVAPEDAPPSLVIVADEFATLVKEIPDFVAGIVDIAQRGRSLGIHLVLATQRPAGAVNDNILANTNLRISLRTLDPADSSSIIGVPDAASIPVPLRGRAFARTGPGAPVPFQSAWAGAPYGAATQEASVVVRPFGFGSGGAAPAHGQADSQADGVSPEAAKDDPETQLEIVVRACADAAALAGRQPPRRPWVEPLPGIVALDDVLADVDVHTAADPGRWAIVGSADEPEAQRRYPVAVDLEATGGLLVFGTGGSGKTTLLRTVAAAFARQGGSDAVQIHALDFAGRSLTSLQDLPQVAGVIMNDEVERVTRLLTVLRLEIERRRRILAEARAESLSALRAREGRPVLPRLVVLLDGYAGFHSAFEPTALYGWLGELQRIVSEGRQVGVHAVITANRHAGVPTTLLSAISARIVLRMASVDEMSALGVPVNLARGAELPDGRGFLDGRTEVQVASVSGDDAGAAQAAALAALADELRRDGVAPAPLLPELPERLSPLPASTTSLRPVIGVADLTLVPTAVDLSRGNLLITGPPLSGRSAAVAAVVRGITAAPDAPTVVVLGGPGSPLDELAGVARCGIGRAAASAAIDEALALVADEDGTAVRVVVCIDAAEDFETPDVAGRLEALARHDAVRLVVVADGPTLSRSFSGWIAELKHNRTVLLLQPDSPLEVESMTGRRVALRPEQAFPPGRGVLVDRRAATLVQVVSPSF